MKKNYLLYFLLLALSTPIWVSCNDWTESEAKDYFEGPSEEYYAALRAYKKSDHPKAFGWFGNWTGEGASLVNSMAGIPDSMDVVSIWGNWSNITEAQKKDLKFCQEVKGTRFTMCFIITSVGTQITPQHIYDNWESMGFASHRKLLMISGAGLRTSLIKKPSKHLSANMQMLSLIRSTNTAMTDSISTTNQTMVIKVTLWTTMTECSYS